MKQENTDYKCQIHPMNPVSFFCTVNQWHFVPLCSECLPGHTQSHPKNMKVTIQSSAKVREKYLAQQKNAVMLYLKKLAEIDTIIEMPKESKEQQLLEKSKSAVMELVDGYFKNLKIALISKRQQVEDYQRDLITKLRQNVLLDIQELRSVDGCESGSQWADQVKRIYFKDGAQAYIDEISQILEDHHERVHGRKHIVFPSEQQTHKAMQQIQKILTATYAIAQSSSEEKKKVQPKKSQKMVKKPKKCKVCGGELQYLTEWKKHLICPVCGGKQRNYIKQKQ